MKTLLLDQLAWDLVLDTSGNIAVASNPYSLAQDVGSAIKTFFGEVYYNTLLGINYFEQVLGQLPPSSLIIQLMINAALTVPGVVSAQCVINSFTTRSVTGQVTFVDSDNQVTTVTF
jgi:hypothetical protein